MLGFAGVMLFLLWSGAGEFARAPLDFRVGGTFVLLFFGLLGWGLFWFRPPQPGSGPRHNSRGNAPANFACTNCGAAVADGAEVSPSGDAKCPHCGRWFNIHRGPA